jgi:hypothetical protein
MEALVSQRSTSSNNLPTLELPTARTLSWAFDSFLFVPDDDPSLKGSLTRSSFASPHGLRQALLAARSTPPLLRSEWGRIKFGLEWERWTDGIQDRPASSEGVFRFPFHPKIFLGFVLSFYRMELNTMQNYWQKVSILHFGFWPQEIKKAKKPSPTL